jgi:hypothetical protein
MAASKKRGNRQPSGPKPEVLKIEGDWEAAVARALKRGKPSPEPPKRKPRKKKGD